MLLNTNNLQTLLRAAALPLMAEGLMMLLAALPAAHFADGTTGDMLCCGLFAMAVGGMVQLSVPKPAKKPEQRVAYLIVVSLWIVLMLFAALPFLATGATTHFTTACFEAMAGLTTTGVSDFAEVEALPASIIFWRSVLQWVGGYGIVLLVLAVVPSLGINKYSLYTAETSSADNTGKVTAGTASTIRRTLSVYVLLTVGFFLVLCTMGMQPWDALNYAFASISTGGAAPYSTGYAALPVAQQGVLAAAMLLGGMNFILLYHLFTLQWRKARGKTDQLRTYVGLAVAAALLVVLMLRGKMGYPWPQAWQEGVLQTISAATTTGAVMADTSQWWTPLPFLLVVLSLCGGMAGSTSGGLKTMRVLILWRSVRTLLINRLHPHAVNPVRLNGSPVREAMIRNVMVIFLVYLLALLAGTAALLLCGVGGREALGATVACLTSSGQGLGLCSGLGDYAFMRPAAHWVMVFLMLLGRLECLTLLVLLLPAFWRK